MLSKQIAKVFYRWLKTLETPDVNKTLESNVQENK